MNIEKLTQQMNLNVNEYNAHIEQIKRLLSEMQIAPNAVRISQLNNRKIEVQNLKKELKVMSQSIEKIYDNLALINELHLDN